MIIYYLNQPNFNQIMFASLTFPMGNLKEFTALLKRA